VPKVYEPVIAGLTRNPVLDVGRAHSRQVKKLKYIIQRFTKMRTNIKPLFLKVPLVAMDSHPRCPY